MSYKNVKEIREHRQAEFGNDPDNSQQLPLIAEEIQSIVRKFKRDILQLGKLLTEAKKLLGHGNFQKWVEKNIDFSYATANNFMNVYSQCLNEPLLVSSIQSTVLYTISSPNFPKDLRDYLFNNSEDLDVIKKPKLREIVKRYKNGEIDLDSPEIKALIKYRGDRVTYKEYMNKIEDNINVLNKLRDEVINTTKTIKWPTMPNKQRTELTNDLKVNIEYILNEIMKVVHDIMPSCEVVDSIKPTLME